MRVIVVFHSYGIKMKRIKSRIISPLKFFGAKYYQIQYIIPKLEYRPIFIEGFFCTGVVSLNIDEGFVKHICIDKNPQIVNFWNQLKKNSERMYKFLCNVEYSEENFQAAKRHVNQHLDDFGDEFFDAVMFLICNRMSRSADMKTFGWSDRLRRGMPEYISAYHTMINSLYDVSNRIKNIEFICDDYISYMLESGLNEDEKVVSYCDPPYIKDTRVSKNSYGNYEMPTHCHEEKNGKTSHEKLINFFKNDFAGISYLSGYLSPQYEEWLKGYNRYEYKIANSSSQKKTKPRKTECIWQIG